MTEKRCQIWLDIKHNHNIMCINIWNDCGKGKIKTNKVKTLNNI